MSMCGWNGQDGVTISLQRIWSTLALAMLINRTFILSHLPASAMMGRFRAKRFLPFADLFDINILRRAYGPSCCVSPNEVDKSISSHTRTEGNYHQLLREFKDNKSRLIDHKHIQVCEASFDLVLKANITSVYENTQPHPSLRKIIRSGLHRFYGSRKLNTTSHSYKNPAIICMHLRTEQEFLNYFRKSPAAYTREQILMKMELTRNQHSNTSFSKLWLQNENLEVKPVLYLAGGDNKDNRKFFMKTGWFSAVENKDSIFNTSNNKYTSFAQLLKQYKAPSSLLSSLKYEISTVLAIIDLEICKKADIFIGNNRSSFSERVATERQRSSRWEKNDNRTLESGGQYNYMVNALAADASSWKDLSKLEPLHPFCAANSLIFVSYKCN